jgi:hypothetical protein
MQFAPCDYHATVATDEGAAQHRGQIQIVQVMATVGGDQGLDD